MTSYLADTSLLLSIYYAFYMLVMRKTTFFRLNRIAILSGSAACLLLPLIELGVQVPEYVTALPHLMLPETIQTEATTEVHFGLTWHRILAYAYLLGCVSVLAYTSISLAKTIRFARRYAARREGAYLIHIVPDGHSPFSIFRHIFISHEDYTENPAILTHEEMHARFHHSADLLLMDLLTAFQWFNPLVWLMSRELKMLHEYQADEAVISQGIDATLYQLLLVRKAVGTERFMIANNFRHSSLKNRITMMIKEKTNKCRKLAYLACLPLLFISLCLCSNRDVQNGRDNTDPAPAAADEIRPEGSMQNTTDTATALGNSETAAISSSAVETPPKFNGEGINEFAQWLMGKLVYPESAKKAGIDGRAMVQFTVSSTGKVCDVKIVRGIDPEIDKAVLETVSSSPDWTPGMIDGKPVAVSYMIPVVFQLSE